MHFHPDSALSNEFKVVRDTLAVLTPQAVSDIMHVFRETEKMSDNIKKSISTESELPRKKTRNKQEE